MWTPVGIVHVELIEFYPLGWCLSTSDFVFGVVCGQSVAGLVRVAFLSLMWQVDLGGKGVFRQINGTIWIISKETRQNMKPLSWAKDETNWHFRCENTIIHINSSLKILGVNISDLLKFDNHLFKISRKVSQQIVVARRLKKMLPFETGRDLYLSFIALHVKYCSEPWHFCSKGATDKLELGNKWESRQICI